MSVADGFTEQYEARTPESRRLYEERSRQTPGGVHANIKYYAPYPLTFAEGRGAHLHDVDGHRYVDYLLAFGALVLGHGHPALHQAIAGVWERSGTVVFGAPSSEEGLLAERIQSLYPSIERLRYTNSGLEATMLALRLALAYTGRSKVAKFAGHYHGAHDRVLVSSEPANPRAGETIASSYGLPPFVVEHTFVLPFNDWAPCDALLREHGPEIGAVILEPLLGGVVPADPAFLRQLRGFTRELGIPLIFDEVKTGFRVALGGAQGWYQVAPDLTCLGKVIGGGLPIGVVGGRRDLIDLCSPLRSPKEGGPVFHSGTFNANPLALSAGLATVGVLEEPGVFPALVAHADRLRAGLEQAGAACGFQVRTAGIGTVFDLFFAEEAPKDAPAWAGTALERRRAFDFFAMARGVFTKPQHRLSVSTAHDDATARKSLEAWAGAFSDLGRALARPTAS